MQAHRRTVLAGFATIPLMAWPGQQETSEAAVDRLIGSRMAAKGIPGGGAAIVREGRPLLQRGYGAASLELDVPATADTLFPMASASKVVASLVAGRLVDAGRLDLDAPARQYLPELPDSLAAVRVHHLLSHTSGLAGPGANPRFVAERADRERRDAWVGPLKLDVFTDEEVLAYGAAAGLAEPPGTQWRYSQFPYFLVGLIVGRLCGATFAEAVAREVFAPLGITRAVYGDHRTVVPGRPSTNYTRQFGPLQHFALRYTPGYWPAAGLNMSAADALRLLAAFEPGRLLRADTLTRLWQPARLADGTEARYALGFSVTTSNGRRWVGHEGGGCCYVGWWPEQRLGIVVLFNLSGAREDGIEAAIADLVLSQA
ncbi:serine hydrolase [Luteitalea sp. TBR-22]|uniref:serine hydrolase domain-containing protein n=1 Tax=Luteitalea sp. TBR-22 TaxID=2802971 RepID=UPI001AF156BA|nr:serine hydrolase domain-containing protein [Luteitalea sp. TBR-22]BCS31712.1 serine hydrolase [Luteitalea sp. TBR-22]